MEVGGSISYIGGVDTAVAGGCVKTAPLNTSGTRPGVRLRRKKIPRWRRGVVVKVEGVMAGVMGSARGVKGGVVGEATLKERSEGEGGEAFTAAPEKVHSSPPV